MADHMQTPPVPLVATAYETLAANIIEQTFNERRTQALQGSHEIDSPKVFADVLAVETMKAYEAANPNLESLHATTSETKLGDGSLVYNVALRDADGGGVSFGVSSRLEVGATAYQGFADGKNVQLPVQNFRWNEHGGLKDSYLEHSVGSGGPNGLTYVPYSNPSLAGGDDLEGGLKLIADQSMSSFGSGKPNRPAVIMASANDVSHEGVRTVSVSNHFGTIKNGYSQRGEITYNGFSVVEQNVGSGSHVFYNKADLLRNADDRPALEALLNDRGKITISVTDDHVRGRGAPSKADAQAAVASLREAGTHMASVSKLEPWDGKAQTGSFIDLGDGVVAQHAGRGIYRYMDVNEQLAGVLPPMGQTVSVNHAGQVSITEPAREHSLGR